MALARPARAEETFFSVPVATPIPNSSPPTSGVAAAAEEERVVGPLLARANLLRLRGQWDEAAVACTEALRLVPNSPSACSLLGDIYEAQRRLDEALQWYGMAVEFDPTNGSDRAKLERVAQVQRRVLLREEHEAHLRTRRTVPAAAGPARDRTSNAHKTLQWFDRIFPPGRWDSAARLILLSCGAMAFILLFAAGFVYLSSRDDRAPGGGALDAPLSADAAPGTGQNVVVMPPAPSPIPAPNDAASAMTGPNPSAPTGTGNAVLPAPPPLTPNSGVPAAPLPANNDPALLDALRRAFAGTAGGGIQVAAAEVDERVPQISLSLVLPASAAGGVPAEARARVLRAAARAVRVAGEQRPRIDRALVRVQFAPPAVPSGGATLAFSGETATTAVRAARGESASETVLRGLFINPVWGSGLAP